MPNHRQQLVSPPLPGKLSILFASLLCSAFIVRANQDVANDDDVRRRVAVIASLLEERDCSHLKGRQLSDCSCRVVMPGVEQAWGQGDVLAANMLARPCDAGSPGLTQQERTLLNAVDTTSHHLEAAQKFEEEKKHLDAVMEFVHLFNNAKRVVDTSWAFSHETFLAIEHCSLWARALPEYQLSSSNVKKRYQTIAQEMYDICRAARKFHAQTASPTHGSNNVVGELTHAARSKMAKDLKSFDAWCGNRTAFCAESWILGGQVFSLRISHKYKEAITLLSSYGIGIFPSHSRSSPGLSVNLWKNVWRSFQALHKVYVRLPTTNRLLRSRFLAAELAHLIVEVCYENEGPSSSSSSSSSSS